MYLKRKNDHEDPLFSVGEDVLDEGPAGPDEDDGEEEQGTFQQVSDIVENGPEIRNQPFFGWADNHFCIIRF